eukprot:CAMPEP_0206144554 /NCGR_PEP_ID=MMETSP1473-20131121/24455_1 /ASSEMBLY_ACC=CAM_ASM_001109 /TAXON_ID=1461547 /ORGANISM="Stichococcus sp, Strain RCC1054" /LENGTH=322 /DNA_ID=CAMNT_0053540401 /DNA_START=55 /DNA_END=1023 /DNA_ORIENTATION=+
MPLQKGRYVSNIIVFGAGLVTAMLLGWRNTATNTTTALNGCDPSVLSELYLATVAKSVTGILLETPYYFPFEGAEDKSKAEPFNAGRRAEGLDWPVYGLTMTGLMRIENIKSLLDDVLDNKVPGDFAECGVWRGGASLFARAVFAARGVTNRKVHVVDSFAGLPTATNKKDNDLWSRLNYISVPQEEVRRHFEAYNLLDEQVSFTKGFFRYSLPTLRQRVPDLKLSVLRLDGDMYESTMDALFNLWDTLSVGGYMIIDDWMIDVCQQAINEFYKMHDSDFKPIMIDRGAAYIKKTSEFPVPLKRSWYTEFNETRGVETNGKP